MTQLRRKLNCLLIEQDQASAACIELLINQSASLELVKSSTAVHHIAGVLGIIHIDVIFIDVDSMDLEDLIRFKISSPASIFLLLSNDPLFEITIANPGIFDCLIKPITLSRFELAIARVRERFVHLQAQGEDRPQKVPEKASILIRSGGEQHQLATADILYIESDGEYVKYYTGKTKYMVLGSLKKLARQLGHDFVQVHRSYVVNRACVVAKTRQHIELTGQRMIPIGKTFKNAFQFFSADVQL